MKKFSFLCLNYLYLKNIKKYIYKLQTENYLNLFLEKYTFYIYFALFSILFRYFFIKIAKLCFVKLSHFWSAFLWGYRFFIGNLELPDWLTNTPRFVIIILNYYPDGVYSRNSKHVYLHIKVHQCNFWYIAFSCYST